MKKLWYLVVALGLILVGSALVYPLLSPNSPQPNPILETPSHETSKTSSTSSQESQANDTNQVLETTQTAAQANQLPDTRIWDSKGKSHALKDQLDKPLVISFWASWCPPCQEEMPLFQDYFDQYGNQINFVMLNATESKPSETVEVAQKYINDHQFTFPVYYDRQQENQVAYGAMVLPSTIFVNRDGQVTAAYRGQLTAETMDAELKKLLAN
ncbi:TlpA family protein disulfide reductase [Vaginisenegalia massiliensis]|uniref:TlpA family protein disulfide reductase n=1 Tax=Vaginisenegalia massiliensis TaxID=2058294 RepID=UPI000F533988|nr:TlpA disulfide reductase family protein [Vaginisenegalia massiliensis]